MDQTLEIPEIDFARARLTWSNEIQVGDERASVERIMKLGEHMTDERRARLEEVVAERSLHVVSVLENIHDRGNVSAAMRSSEAFGFLGMYLIDPPGAKFKASKRVTKGTEKWLDVRQHSTAASAAGDLRARGYQIWATDLNTQHSIDTLDWSKPIALVLGNEKDGVSDEMKSLADGTFRIPMLGFAQSFNISVAAALLFYRGYLETRALGEKAKLTQEERDQVLANYYLRCFDNPESLLTRKE